MVEPCGPQETPEPVLAPAPPPSTAAGGSERRFSSGEKLLLIFIAVTVVLALGAFGAMLLGVLRGQPEPFPMTPTPDHRYLDNKELGQPDAKVDVLVALPLSGCQGPAIEYVAKVAQAYPQHIHARFVDFFAAHGKAEARRISGGPPCIAINGSDRFTRPSGENIRLGGPLDEDYTVADLRLALQAKLNEAYGPNAPQLPPPGESDESAEK